MVQLIGVVSAGMELKNLARLLINTRGSVCNVSVCHLELPPQSKSVHLGN